MWSFSQDKVIGVMLLLEVDNTQIIGGKKVVTVKLITNNNCLAGYVQNV